MKEFKGTPGKWSASDDEESMATSVIISDSLDIIAVVGTYMTSTEEDYANAKLIAAAPELLAALRDIVEASTPFHSALEIDQQFDGEALYSNAVKAIKKASGE